jgi:hypothetical protein
VKAVLEFDLPSEDREFRNANLAGEMMGTLWNMDQFLRSTLKHGSPKDPDLLQYLRDMIPEYVREA